MTSKRKPYKTFTREFKLEAVKMMRESDRPSSEIATELGIRRNQLYKWKDQLDVEGEVIIGQKNVQPAGDQENHPAQLFRVKLGGSGWR